MKGILFLFWFLASFLPVVLALENPTPTTDWHNSFPENAHQKESLAHGWFKYPSGHWGCKFHYGCSSTPPPLAEPSLVRSNASFYLLTYVVGYYLLGYFSSMMGRFSYLGHSGHLVIITWPIDASAASRRCIDDQPIACAHYVNWYIGLLLHLPSMDLKKSSLKPYSTPNSFKNGSTIAEIP
ncbi:hypothetical protein DSO57_1034605 [Entomophthora muscae]|uniref:Uncharacterized protein n=1 Tax=Entomophthora muscae TaxID=34485 RepID=A0ACC2TLQ8_9FUNG|nr:hypothetical protein DSO57_1034605 [Entomophthora muscae]